jgi:hypothetical protein
VSVCLSVCLSVHRASRPSDRRDRSCSGHPCSVRLSLSVCRLHGRPHVRSVAWRGACDQRVAM